MAGQLLDRAAHVVDALTAGLARRAWQRHSAGNGAKGPRDDDWAWITINPDHA